MKKIYSILLLPLIAVMISSCWEETKYKAGQGRHQVTEFKALPGDCEALLTWTMSEGWNPTDFIVTYSNENQEEVVARTGGKMEYLVGGLQNNYQYTFKVQAVYGTVISQAVEAAARPATTRFAVGDLAGTGSDGMVTLTWTCPGARVDGYRLEYVREGDTDRQTEQIGADVETYTVDNLENDVNYLFTLVASYPNGESEPVTVRVMPTQAIPYFVNRTEVSVGEPVEFTFNREGLPMATGVKWTFPDGTVLEGDVVTGSFSSANEDSRVILSARIGSVEKSWPISINVRLFAVMYTEWIQDGTAYNGFKGTCPVFSPDGKIVYIVTFNKISALYAFEISTGKLVWSYTPETKSGSYNMLTVNPVNGDIYYGTTTAGQFYCVSSLGSLRWTYKGAASMQSAAPAVSADGATVYIVDKNGRAAAIDALTGAERWNAVLTGHGSGILVSGQDIVIGTKNNLYILDAADGNITKTMEFSKNNGMSDITGFAVAGDRKTVYIPQFNGHISSFDLDRKDWIVKDFKVGGNTMYEPVVAPCGDVFVGGKDSKAYIVDGALTAVKATVQVRSLEGKNNGYNYSHPVVDSEGNFYITSGQVMNTVIKVSPDGRIVDEWNEGSTDAQKQMGGNNFINGILFSAFIGANGDNGMFVGKYVGGERAMSWSSHGGDICGSCCLK